MSNRSTKMILGILLITIGVISIGNQLRWWSLPSFSGIWWTLLIIIPFFADIISKGLRFTNIIGLAAGVWFLLIGLRLFEIVSLMSLTIPGAIILLGVAYFLN